MDAAEPSRSWVCGGCLTPARRKGRQSPLRSAQVCSYPLSDFRPPIRTCRTYQRVRRRLDTYIIDSVGWFLFCDPRHCDTPSHGTGLAEASALHTLAGALLSSIYVDRYFVNHQPTPSVFSTPVFRCRLRLVGAEAMWRGRMSGALCLSGHRVRPR